MDGCICQSDVCNKLLGMWRSKTYITKNGKINKLKEEEMTKRIVVENQWHANTNCIQSIY